MTEPYDIADYDFAHLRLPVDDFLLLVMAAQPLWEALSRLGWTDGFGGMEFRRVFPQALTFIRFMSNLQAPTGSHD